MAGKKCTLFKASQMPKRGPMTQAAKGDPEPNEYGLLDNEDGSVSVFGINKAGNQVDLTGVANLSAQSNNPTVLDTGEVVDMTVPYNAKAAGKAVVLLTVTADDDSYTFSLDDPCDVGGSPVAGLAVTHGKPVAR